jgi:predicted transcriptional regulator
MDIHSESLYGSLLEQLGHRGKRGLLKGAKTTATKSCLEMGLLIGKMVGTGEATEEWGMQALLAIGKGNWNFFSPSPPLDPVSLAKWKPHPRCVAFYHPTYLDRVLYQLALHSKNKAPAYLDRGPLTSKDLSSKLQLTGTRQQNHLERILIQAVRKGVLRRGIVRGGMDRKYWTYTLANPEQTHTIIQQATVDPKCTKCQRRLGWSS